MSMGFMFVTGHTVDDRYGSDDLVGIRDFAPAIV